VIGVTKGDTCNTGVVTVRGMGTDRIGLLQLRRISVRFGDRKWRNKPWTARLIDNDETATTDATSHFHADVDYNTIISGHRRNQR